MGWASTRPGPTRFGPGTSPLEARPVVCYVGRETVTVKKFYFRPAPARARVGQSTGLTLLSFVFQPKTVKNTQKKKHKTWVRPARSTSPACGPVDKFCKFQARPATHGPRPGIYPSPRAEPVNRLDPCRPLIRALENVKEIYVNIFLGHEREF